MLTSMTTSRTPPLAAASMVASESTATVTRASSAPRRVQSITSLASSRSWPRPAAVIPSTSRMVAQVNPGWPACAWRLAKEVHLWALTWGRRRDPGRASAIVLRLWPTAPASTTRAGVVSSATCTPPAYPVTDTGGRLVTDSCSVAAMGAAGWLLLGVAGALSVADWAAVGTANKRLEYVSKPAVMVALIGVAIVIQPAAPAQR